MWHTGSSKLTAAEALIQLRDERTYKVGAIQAAIPVLITLGILFCLVVLVNYILIKTVRTDLLKYRKISEMERQRMARA